MSEINYRFSPEVADELLRALGKVESAITIAGRRKPDSSPSPWYVRAWRRLHRFFSRNSVATIGYYPVGRTSLYDVPYLYIDGVLQAEQRTMRWSVRPLTKEDPVWSADKPNVAGVSIYAEHAVSTNGEHHQLYAAMQECKRVEAKIVMGGTSHSVVANGMIHNVEMVSGVSRMTVVRFEFIGTTQSLVEPGVVRYEQLKKPVPDIKATSTVAV